jgi:hypothetical protein
MSCKFCGTDDIMRENKINIGGYHEELVNISIDVDVCEDCFKDQIVSTIMAKYGSDLLRFVHCIYPMEILHKIAVMRKGEVRIIFDMDEVGKYTDICLVVD